jgi:hypothetical protein
MALPTLVSQLRDSTVTDAVARFEVITTVTDRGDLPDLGAFVLEIIDTSDPKQDELLRVADVGDLTEYRIDRSQAVLFGELYYREATVTKVYDAIQDAINAKDFIQEELNQLAADWQQFITDFQANPAEMLAFPVADVGVLTPLIETYNETVALRQQQQTDVVEKTAECAEIDLLRAQADADVLAAQASLDALNVGKAGLVAASGAMGVFATEVKTGTQPEIELAFTAWDTEEPGLAGVKTLTNGSLLGPLSGSFRAYYPTLQTAVTTFDQEIAAASAAITALDAQIATQTAAVGAAEGAQTGAAAAAAACSAELVSMQAVLDELETLEQQQLNTIVALCPTFTP